MSRLSRAFAIVIVAFIVYADKRQQILSEKNFIGLPYFQNSQELVRDSRSNRYSFTNCAIFGNSPAQAFYGQPANYGYINQNTNTGESIVTYAYLANKNYNRWNYGNINNNKMSPSYGTLQILLPMNVKSPAQIQLPYSNAYVSLRNITANTVVMSYNTVTTTPTIETATFTDLANIPSNYCNVTKRAMFRRHLLNPVNDKESINVINTLKLPLVLPILYGAFHNQNDRLTMYPSVVLVIDENSRTHERRFIMVDTGLSHLKDPVVSGLQAHGVDPSVVDTVIITHPDTDTMGNLNLFPCAQIFASNRISKENLFVEKTPPTFNINRSDLPFHTLFDNTELYLTPGFGLQDQSLLVHNVENHGTVAIVGKLILNQTDLIDSTEMSIREFANDDLEQKKLWQAARREIVCLADYIIPGHGVPFKISAELKHLAECSKRQTIFEPLKLKKYFDPYKLKEA